MLQPSQDQQLNTARMIWGALIMAGFMYGFVLFTTGKVSRIEMPSGELTPFEMMAIAANLIAVVTFFFHKDRIQPTREFQKKFVLYILCWALNESIVIMGFMAVFLSESGNAFYYVTNLVVALTANILTFPKK